MQFTFLISLRGSFLSLLFATLCATSIAQETQKTQDKQDTKTQKPTLEITSEAQAMSLLAAQAFSQGNWDEAVLAYAEVLKADPQNPLVRSNLGQALYRKGEFEQAATQLEKALAQKAELPNSWLALGMCYQRLERPYAAIAAFSKAIDLEPENAMAHQLLGVVMHRKGWANAARLQMQEALRLKPDFAAAHYNLAVTYLDVRPPSVALAARHYQYSLETGGAKDEAFEARLKQAQTTSNKVDKENEGSE